MAKYKASGGNTAGVASEIVEFGNYLKGINKADVKRKPSGDLVKRYRVKLIPFNVTPTATTPANSFFTTALTGQALAIYNGLGTENRVFGITPIETANDATGAFLDDNLFPALARVLIVPLNATISNETSGITKKGYKTIKGRSGSIPFGRTITGITDVREGTPEDTIDRVDEADVSNSIANTIKKTYGSFRVKSVSFVPEAYVPPVTQEFAPATAPAIVF